MPWINDEVVNISTDEYPGPWTIKTRIYQKESLRGENWFFIADKAYDANGNRIDKTKLSIPLLCDSGISGTAEFLGIDEEEKSKVLYTKNFFF